MIVHSAVSIELDPWQTGAGTDGRIDRQTPQGPVRVWCAIRMRWKRSLRSFAVINANGECLFSEELAQSAALQCTEPAVVNINNMCEYVLRFYTLFCRNFRACHFWRLNSNRPHSNYIRPHWHLTFGAYAAIATKPVHRLQICPIVHRDTPYTTLPSYIRVRAVVWECDEGQTDRHTRTHRRPSSLYISLCYVRCEM